MGLCPTQGRVIPGMPHMPCPTCPPTQESCSEVMVTDFCPLGGLSYSLGTPGAALRAPQFCIR